MRTMQLLTLSSVLALSAFAEDAGVDGGVDAGVKAARRPLPRLEPGELDTRGAVDRALVDKALRANLSVISTCAEELQNSGTFSLRLIVDAAGVVTLSKVIDSSLENEKFAACVATTAQRLTFPAPRSGVVIITAPYRVVTP